MLAPAAEDGDGPVADGHDPTPAAATGDPTTGTRRTSGIRGFLTRLSDAAARLWRGARGLWRTSLQFRVVLTTMLIGTVLTVTLQSFLYGRIADGLVSARMEMAQNDAAQSAADLRRVLDEHDQADAEEFLTSTHDVIGRQEENENREITLNRSPSNRSGPAAIVAFDTSYPPEMMPEDLRQAISDDPTHQQVQIVPLPVGDQPDVPAVVVGTQIVIPEAGPYELYYIYPMAREERLMVVIWRVFLVGSVAIVATLGLVAFIVTRLVVDPLRQASEVAGRLSGGHLNERMLVRGEDDIARLATAFNDMAEHLQQQIRQLEDLSRVQQRFVSDVSHELRTPLTTIHMASEVIHDQRDGFDPVVARSTELLYAQVQRFEELLADLLEISRFDAGGAVLDLERVDLRDIVSRAIVGAEQLAVSRGSEVLVVGGEVPREAAVEPRRIERILRNLLVNAIEHGEGRPVTIELGSDDDAVAIVVADRGIGLKPGRPTSCSTGSGAPTPPVNAPPAAPASAWPSPSRTPTCTAAGCRPGASRAPAPGSGSRCRAPQVPTSRAPRSRSNRRSSS
ncbi:hypothetical protein GCM10025883_10270 [Mobilicoccus caccae]|uniref:Sensor histidine kinase MtrB n=1 Tax=Mobilicoccus caccae TaxID=1859295 RepID=A0ABQ6IM43_9MICO|nr:hypothetical protein GCM10025883_10270 [Mobilicoccus caccae]